MADRYRDNIIFPDSTGFWNTISKKEEEEQPTGRSFYESLVPTMNPSSNPQATWDPASPAANANNVIEQLVGSQQRIDTLTAEMKANVDVNSAAGSDALRRLLADPQQEPETRAAASQALYPGMKANIGRFGELSFTAAPGTDINTDYAKQAARTNPQLAANTKPALDRLDTMFSNIQNLESPEDIIAAYSEIQIVANEFLAGKKSQYESQLARPLGVDQFESALANSRALDRQAWNQYYGGANMGDSDETMALIARQTQIRGILDEQVNGKLQSDPDAIAVSSRMRWLDGMIQARLGDLDTVTRAGLVQPASIDAAAEGMGYDPLELTLEQRKSIADGIANGDSQTLAAMQIGQASIPDLLNIASSASGRPTVWATEALSKKFDSPEMGKQLIQAVKNFDQTYLAGMTEEQAAEFRLSPAQEQLTGKDRERAVQEIQSNKIRHVLNDVNTKRATAFEQSIGQWAAPQAPEIAEEWVAVAETLSSSMPEDSVISFQHIVNGMDWDVPANELTPKIRATAEYIASQAGKVSESRAMGPLPLYSDPLQVESMINSIIVGQRMQKARSRVLSGDNIGSALNREGLWGWGSTLGER